MQIGGFTQQFDLPLLLVDLFFVFFLCLVYYLRQEDKREGYPLVSHRTRRSGGRVKVVGFPPMPKPKAFIQPHGKPTVYAPAEEHLPPIHATNLGNPNGMPIEPIGDPLLSGTGAAAWVPKSDEPELSHDGKPLFVPLRAAPQFRVMKGDADPRGFEVLGLDKAVAGQVVDIWLDKSEHYARFFEVELAPSLAETRARKNAAEAPGDKPADDHAPPPLGARILLPAEFASVNGRARTVRTAAIPADRFAQVPGRKKDATLTALEEQRIRAYFGGGWLWATPARMGPVL